MLRGARDESPLLANDDGVIHRAAMMVLGEAAAMQVGRNKVRGEAPSDLAPMIWDSRKFSAEYREELFREIAQATIERTGASTADEINRLLNSLDNANLAPHRMREIFIALGVMAGTKPLKRVLGL